MLLTHDHNGERELGHVAVCRLLAASDGAYEPVFHDHRLELEPGESLAAPAPADGVRLLLDNAAWWTPGRADNLTVLPGGSR